MVYIITEKYTPRFKYIAEHIFKRILCTSVTIVHKMEEVEEAKKEQGDGPIICYSRVETLPDALNICPEGLVFQDDVRAQDIKVSDWNGTKIFYQTTDTKYDLPFDIFSASFFLLSRYEEYYGAKNEYGCFRAEDSLAFKNGFLDRPIVDEWAYILEDLLVKKCSYVPEKKKNFMMHSSVVIDNYYKYRYNSVAISIWRLFMKLISGDFKSFKHQLRVRLFLEADPYANFDKIIQLHKHTNLTPSFYVLIKKGYNECHNLYSNFHALRKALRRNYNTGLHPSLQSNSDTKKLRKELKTLEKKIVMQRVQMNMFHLCRFSIPKSYESLMKIGITDDYSMSYPNMIGFRAGTCTPFRFYDLKHECKTRLMVHSLIISATSLKGMGIHHSEIESAVIPYMNRVKAVNGQFCASISNEVLSNTGKWYGWDTPIERIYKYASCLEFHSIEAARDAIK
ncbi:MAG: hypothetical protein MJ003_06005 [Paludibacteraceae bacterium]|nr:hypothetical protein [Paludibacteraceae bacterium]